jgi:hypothetical protein
VSTLRIVPTLDPAGTPGRCELEHCPTSLFLGAEAATIQQLAFQGGEEALAQGIIVTVTDGSHGRTFAFLHRFPKAIEVYWLPWSEWWITASGRRRRSAIWRASTTSSLRRWLAMDQPTTRRLQASTTTARYKEPVQVEMYVTPALAAQEQVCRPPRAGLAWQRRSHDPPGLAPVLPLPAGWWCGGVYDG